MSMKCELLTQYKQSFKRFLFRRSLQNEFVVCCLEFLHILRKVMKNNRSSRRKSIFFCLLICLMSINFAFGQKPNKDKQTGQALAGSSVKAQIKNTQTFSNPSPIVIGNESGKVGIGYPYPSTINVNGSSDPIIDINVRINGLTNGGDVGLLLVAPSGLARMVLQSDVGNFTNVTYTIDDQAKNKIPSHQVSDGTYRPTSVNDDETFPQIGNDPPPVDCRPAGECPQPAPAGNATLNGTFGGVTANGIWKLYVIDCCAPYSGNISGGWSLIITTAENNPDVPVLTLEAGTGITAEFSDYSLRDYGVTNGIYKASFCFTLKNTSKQSPTQLPIFLPSIGLSHDQHRPNFPTLVNYSIVGRFNGIGVNHPGDPGKLFLYAYRSTDTCQPGNPNNGIPPGETASFCLVLENKIPLELDNLIDRFFVTFFDGIGSQAIISDMELGNHAFIQGLSIQSMDANQVCFSTYQCSPLPNFISIGFDLPKYRGPFILDSIDSNDFRFLTMPYSLRYLTENGGGRRLDFGIGTGQLFAKGRPRTGFRACVNGNFSGLTPWDIINSTVIRFDNEWGRTRAFGICGPRYVIMCSPGIRGTVSTNPRLRY